MSVEIESVISILDISLALSEVGAEFVLDKEGVSGNFKKSLAYFVFSECEHYENVVTDGANVAWLVGARGAFHCRIDHLSESSDDIKQFLYISSEMINCRFFFSFQYESVYAIRDETGLHYLKEMVI